MAVKANEIRAAMAKRWAAPEYALMWEVGNATGSGARRFADAVIMSLWPSRGLELHGVEIKVSRSDWKREAADPTKAEAVARYCDRWWVHTAPGVVDDLSALPPLWGLREFDGKAWRTVREAEKSAAEPVDRQFLAALLRRADETMRRMVDEAAREGQEKTRAEAEQARKMRAEEIQRAVDLRMLNLEDAAKNVRAFEAAFGKGSAVDWAVKHPELGAAARALSQCGPGGYSPLSARLRKAADELDAIVAMVTPEAAE